MQYRGTRKKLQRAEESNLHYPADPPEFPFQPETSPRAVCRLCTPVQILNKQIEFKKKFYTIKNWL